MVQDTIPNAETPSAPETLLPSRNNYTMEKGGSQNSIMTNRLANNAGTPMNINTKVIGAIDIKF